MSQRKKQKDASRDAILTSAAALLRERGLEGTSVQDATAGAGLTVGTFYAHFTDKQDLLTQAVEVALRQVGGMLDHAAAGRTGIDAVHAITDVYLSELHRDHVRMGCPLPAVLGEAAAVQKSKGTLPQQLVQFLEARVHAAGAGTVQQDEALALVVLLVGGQIIARATRGTPLSSNVLNACRNFAKQRLVATA